MGHLDGDVWNVDLRGHGESSRAPLESYDAAGYAADIAALIDSEIGRPALVVGHSLGGVVAASLRGPGLTWSPWCSSKTPRCTRAALSAGATAPPEVLSRLIAAVRDLQGRNAPVEDYLPLATEPTAEEASARCASLHQWDPTTMEAAVTGIMWSGFDVDATLGCPVTIVRADPTLAVFTADDADRFASANPHARIHEVVGASHTVTRSPTLAPYLTHLQAFVRNP